MPKYIMNKMNNVVEVYQNGIFEFNITKMIEYIQKNSADIMLEAVAVKDF